MSAAHPSSRATAGKQRDGQPISDTCNESTASPVTLLEPTVVGCKGEASATSVLLKEAIGMIKIAVRRGGTLEVIEVYKPCRRRQLGMELSSRPEWSYPKVSSIVRNSLASRASLMVDDEVISISCTCEDPMQHEETIHSPPASLLRERLPSPNEYFAGQGSLSTTGTDRQLERLPSPNEYFAGQGSLSTTGTDRQLERLPSPNEYLAGQGPLSTTRTDRQLVSSAAAPAAELGEVQPCRPQTDEDLILSEDTYV